MTFKKQQNSFLSAHGTWSRIDHILSHKVNHSKFKKIENKSILKEINIHWKNWCWSWSWSSNTLATWCEELSHWKRPWCWERLKVGGAGYDRGWDGWMASLTQWTQVWVNSRSWWWTGRPGVLWSMGLQRVRHDWVTELNWTELATSPGRSSWNILSWSLLHPLLPWHLSPFVDALFIFTDSNLL